MTATTLEKRFKELVDDGHHLHVYHDGHEHHAEVSKPNTTFYDDYYEIHDGQKPNLFSYESIHKIIPIVEAEH